MRIVRNLFVVCAAVLVASAAMAQGGGRGQGMRMNFGPDPSGMTLLMRPDVQKELTITDDQKTKMQDAQKKIFSENQGEFQQGGDMQKAFAKIMGIVQKENEKILTKEQMTRLHEINVQINGNMAATFPDVQKQLGLSEDQISKIKDLKAKHDAANSGLRQKVMDQEMTPDEAREARTKNGETLKTEVGRVLTDDQKTKIKTLGGKVFVPEKKDGGR